MGIFDKIGKVLTGDSDRSGTVRSELIDSGRNKNTGGHDHRTNKEDDRTPSQKEGDKKRRKN